MNALKSKIILPLVWLLLAALTCAMFPLNASAQSQVAGFNPSNLIDNGSFIATDAMSASSIQRFLSNQGSCLKDFSEGGRSAAQIIYDAAHGHGDASGSINGITINTSTGTINPMIILVTLQKEQSLISDSGRCVWEVMRKSMGYGCPDSGGCSAKYAGFTKQVEWGAWQLRYNYERSSGHGFGDYQVGQSFCFDDWNGTHCGSFGNKATAALYRYTPHVYNGNYNFWNLYHNTYKFNVPEYTYKKVTQNRAIKTINSGEAEVFYVKVKNTGRSTWTRNTVYLGTESPRDRRPSFSRLRNADGSYPWRNYARVYMQQSRVAPGGTATFLFRMSKKSSTPIGTFDERFRLVAQGITWMNGPEILWRITTYQTGYHFSIVDQSPNPTINPGGMATLVLKIRNTGDQTWARSYVKLGTADPLNRRIRGWILKNGWVSNNRIIMQRSSVPPGGIATFRFVIQAPRNISSKTYRMSFRPVAGVGRWMENYGIYWDVTVR